MAFVKTFLVCVIGLVTLVNAGDKPKCTQKCEEPIAHYLELGCRAVHSKRNGRCPERYECPFTSRTINPLKCYYKHAEFAIGQRTGKNVIEHPCSVECICTEEFNGRAALTCAQVECPDLFEYDPSKKNCVKQYKKDDCCSYKEICDADEIKALKTCTYDSKVYREGERFQPEGTCKECTCTPDFDGTLKGCKNINCGVEIYHSKDISDKCAPIYLEKRPCCPIEWKCPSDDDEIDVTPLQKNSNPQMRCAFGDKMLNVGDKVMGGDECITCSCNVPPMVTCIRSLEC